MNRSFSTATETTEIVFDSKRKKEMKLILSAGTFSLFLLCEPPCKSLGLYKFGIEVLSKSNFSAINDHHLSIKTYSLVKLTAYRLTDFEIHNFLL